MNPSHEERCIGCLLGTACGDILGSAAEGWSATDIQNEFGRLRDFQESYRGFGRYTDDTQMTIALAVSLVEVGRVDPQHVSAKYAERYEGWRGYGGAAHSVMRALREGADCRATGRRQFPEGSFGNGGAMRIAPLGLAYRHASDDVLRQAVADALLCTHVHPEAIDGAVIQAKAVALATTTASAADFHPSTLLQALHASSQTAVMQAKLEALSDGLAQDDSDVFVIARVGRGIPASEAVSAALWAVVRYWREPEECVIRAVNFGGDTDTIGAMAGAIMGAMHGTAWIPARWRHNIENGENGRDAMVELGRRLAQIDVT